MPFPGIAPTKMKMVSKTLRIEYVYIYLYICVYCIFIYIGRIMGYKKLKFAA